MMEAKNKLKVPPHSIESEQSVLGAMLAIPFTMILAVFLRELSALQRKNK